MNTQDIDEAVLQVIAASPPERMQEMRDVIQKVVRTFLDVDEVPKAESVKKAPAPRRRGIPGVTAPPGPVPPPIEDINVSQENYTAATNMVEFDADLARELELIAQAEHMQEVQQTEEWISQMDQAIQQNPAGQHSYDRAAAMGIALNAANQGLSAQRPTINEQIRQYPLTPQEATPPLDSELLTALQEAQQIRHDGV